MKILEIKDICKSFNNIDALSHVSFSVEEGSITAICGENGSGKSTLMKILSGIHPYGSYQGEIIFNNEECRFKNIKDSEKKGIVIIPQELELCPNLSIAENIFLGHEISKHGIINWDLTKREAYKALTRIGWKDTNVNTLVSSLGVGKQQLVAIAKALAKNAKLLILDEPTASLNDVDSEFLLNLLLDLKKDGLTSIIISHKLDEIEKVADDIVIIRDGTFIESFTKEDKNFSQTRIIKGMVGREIRNLYPNKRQTNFGKVLFEIKSWNAFDPNEKTKQIIFDNNINVRAGEIVGLSGLTGAGRSEMVLSFYQPAPGQETHGTIIIDGKFFKPSTPENAIKNGLVYVTEDRNILGLIKNEEIRRNLSLSSLRQRFSKHSIIDKKAEIKASIEMIEKLGIKAGDIKQQVDTLSGGNAQKVLLGKAILTEPKIIILDEPTKGVDIGAKVEIYSIIQHLANKGKAILLISSEQNEIIGLSDRAYVMSEGRITAELSKENVTAENIVTYAIKGDDKHEIKN